MKKVIISLVFSFFAVVCLGQYKKETVSAKQQKKDERRERINKLAKQEEEGEVVFNKQSVFGLKLATDGFGLSYEFGKYLTTRKSILFQFEFNEKKHQKEKKVPLFDGIGFSNVVYGKLNNFYQTKFGVAQQMRIGGKGNKNGVAVSGIWGGGLSIGLEKPYTVNVVENNVEFKSTFPTIIDSGYNIVGSAGPFAGWKNVKINPGGHAKLAMRFDYGRFNETVTAIEVGLMAEFYAKKVPQLAYVKEKQFFFCGYMSILLGRRK